MNSFSELKRRVDLTSKARYHAASRLNIHGVFSQWTLAFLAIGQVVLALVPVLKIQVNITEQWVVFVGIFFGVLVLAYSLLLGMGNHAARAIRLHQCGMELGRLARKLDYLVRANNPDLADFNEYNNQYYSALEKCENHTRADYLVARQEYYQHQEPFNLMSRAWFMRQKYRFEMYFWHALQFSHYAISVGLISAWILLLLDSRQ